MKSLLISKQSRKPSGLLGHIVARGMARDTAHCNDHAIALLDIQPADRVLDVGCGHGRTVARIAKRATAGFVAGADFSDTMCHVARQTNRRAIRAGRVEIRQADSVQLPYPDASFGKALTVHTLYFWPEPEQHLKEMRRVLRTPGRLLVGYRPNNDGALTHVLPSEVYRLYSTDAVEALLAAAGFRDVATHLARLGPKQYAYTTGRT